MNKQPPSLTHNKNKPLKNYTVNDYSFLIANLATRAILYEVSCFPSPGLVSPISNGAHDDMDYFTFLDSTTSLVKFFILFSEAGFSDRRPHDIFKIIRRIGIEAEQDMFEITNGVNTHKGMIFLMGIACTATAKAIYDKLDFVELPNLIKEMTAGIIQQDLKQLTQQNVASNGEKLFINLGLTGIRGEVESGMPTVFDLGLPFYKQHKGLSKNTRLLQTLFKIMTECEDTTIVHRHSIERLQDVKQQAKKILEFDGVKSSTGMTMINELGEQFIKENISPGGAADLLAVTVFFNLVEEFSLLD